MTSNYMCESCGWRGAMDDILRAPSPFDPEDELVGCPQCKIVEKLHMTCDEPGCTLPVSCGWLSPNGYRLTCGRHMDDDD